MVGVPRLVCMPRNQSRITYRFICPQKMLGVSCNCLFRFYGPPARKNFEAGGRIHSTVMRSTYHAGNIKLTNYRNKIQTYVEYSCRR